MRSVYITSRWPGPALVVGRRVGPVDRGRIAAAVGDLLGVVSRPGESRPGELLVSVGEASRGNRGGVRECVCKPVGVARRGAYCVGGIYRGRIGGGDERVRGRRLKGGGVLSYTVSL